MTKYREILRLHSLHLSQQSIADSCSVSKKTVNSVLKKARELNISWPLDKNQTDEVLAGILFPEKGKHIEASNKRMPDYSYIRKELLRNGVSKKLLWTEYMEECRLNGDEPLMYSQFCYYIQQDEQKHRATMHINRKPGEQVEVDIPVPSGCSYKETKKQEVVRLDMNEPSASVINDPLPMYETSYPQQASPLPVMELSIGKASLRIANGTDPILLTQMIKTLMEFAC